MTDYTTIVIDHEQAPLREIATRINAAITAAEGSAKSAMQHALHAGQLLNEAKARCKPNTWGSFLAEHCCVAQRTAQAYMRLAKQLPLLPADEAQRVAHLPLREAIHAIATKPEAPPSKGCALRIERKDDASRAAQALRDITTMARDSAKRIELLRELSGAQVVALRKKLNATIEAAQSAIQLLARHQQGGGAA